MKRPTTVAALFLILLTTVLAQACRENVPVTTPTPVPTNIGMVREQEGLMVTLVGLCIDDGGNLTLFANIENAGTSNLSNFTVSVPDTTASAAPQGLEQLVPDEKYNYWDHDSPIILNAGEIEQKYGTDTQIPLVFSAQSAAGTSQVVEFLLVPLAQLQGVLDKCIT